MYHPRCGYAELWVEGVRIVFVTTFPTADTGGGMGRVAHELAAASAQAHEVILVCSGEKASVSPPRPRYPTVVRLPTRSERDLRLPDLRQRHWLRALLSDFRPDVVHAQDFSPLALCFQDWARLNGKPFVMTLHCLPSQAQAFGSLEKPTFTRWMGNSPFFRTFISLFLRRCDGVIALNRAMEEDLRRFGYLGPVYRVPNGRDLRAYQTLLPADIGQPERGLLFVGSFARRKNQRYLLEMMGHLDVPARLTLIGETLEPGYLDDLRRAIREQGLDNVDVIGAVPYAEVPRYLQAAHVFVSASRLEVQSLAVIEALASGTPVVGLSNETVDELVDDRVGKRLPADASPAEFARHVAAICRMSPEEYAAICSASRDRVRSFDWNAVVDRNRQVYKELIERRAAVDVRGGRSQLWTPWLVAASSLRYGWHDLTHPSVRGERRRTPARLGGVGRRAR